jgi:SAM-dependent methyltransferase
VVDIFVAVLGDKLALSREFCKDIEIIKGHIPRHIKIYEYESKLYLAAYEKKLNLMREYLKKNVLILDLGCSFGHLTAILADYGYSTIGLDVPYSQFHKENTQRSRAISSMQPELWKKLAKEFNCEFLKGDGKRLPFESNQFDAVLAYAVVEHVQDQVQNNFDGLLYFLGEVNRILKVNGYFFIFECPNKKAYAEKIASLLRIGHHEVLFDGSTLTELLDKQKFNVLKLYRTEMVPSYMPGHAMQRVWNFLWLPLSYLDSMLLKTPLSRFHHHFNVIARKRL